MLEQLETYNRQIFLTMNAQPGTTDGLLQFAYICANVIIYAIPLAVLIVWFAGQGKGKKLMLRCSLTMMTGLVLSLVIGTIWPHPRPFMIPVGYVWFKHTADYSFPSDHVTLFLCFALSLISGKALKPGILVLVASFLVAWSRIFLGVHFPGDMIGAALVSVIATTIINLFLKKFEKEITEFCNRFKLISFR
ncbi:undecaprenyl-diphosphatase [Escherichia coli]|nr:undecaprenyl-diphosphatase [Escherichia coli]HCI5391113.1 undecaprenyl-diphosphatase [Klebsiella pneumoniae]